MQNSNQTSSQPPVIDVPVIPSASTAERVPGFDLIDGVANVLFCPGRAIMLQTAPQGLSGKDLPVVILISAAVWYGMYWLATSQSSPLQNVFGSPVKKRVFRVPRKGKVISSSEEEEDEQEEEEPEDED